jgi:hypothetical protein
MTEVNDPGGMQPDRLGMIGSNRDEQRPCRLESTRLFRQEISARTNVKIWQLKKAFMPIH